MSGRTRRKSIAHATSRAGDISHLQAALTAMVRAAPMVDRVLLEVFSQVCPTTADTDHHPLTMLAHTTNEKLNGSLAIRPGQMVHLDILVAALIPGSWHWSEHESRRGPTRASTR